MPKKLSPETLERFATDGYIDAFPVVPAVEANDFRSQLEAYEQANGGALTGAVRFKSHLLFKWMSDLIRAPVILDAVEDVIGPNIFAWSTDWWIKEAQSQSFVSWHQDSQYWGLDTDKLVTVWVALSPSTVASGCMRVLPGSHLGPDLTHDETFHDDNMLTRGQSIQSIDESQAVNLEVPTGHATMFAFRIAHASHPNPSTDRRIGLAIRYLPPDARQVRSDADSAALVRGTDPYGYFEHEPEPACDFDPASVAYHAETMKVRQQILYQGTQWTTHRT
ncbi:MAG: phytanoyl-CoA dioxygenase [Chromatiales bacterium]|nr:phytanoyl-CoA dioxygenase [Chromatiales bacterium]